tara:strand:- start:951 stop:1601 length:651 start_codon:yes stop_codon:yes gene_type:complete
MATKIFLVDDHPLVRQGLTQIFEKEEDFEVCGEAENAQQAMKAVGTHMPNVVVVDISLQGNNGLELIKNLKAIYEDIPILVFSMHDESTYAQRALRAGAKAYVMKKEPPETIIAAVRRIIKGEIYVSPTVADQVLHQIVNGPSNAAASPIERLTDRELEVVQLIGRGLSTREIAENLGLSIKTIESHRAHVKEKLSLRNATELVQFSVQWVDQQVT